MLSNKLSASEAEQNEEYILETLNPIQIKTTVELQKRKRFEELRKLFNAPDIPSWEIL